MSGTTMGQQNLFASKDNAYQKDVAIIHCDGASSGNPGKAGIGIVINLTDNDARMLGGKSEYRISEYIGTATNNVAEYSAFIKGLEKARSLGISRIKVFLDSELIVRQINGIYKVKNKNLMPLWIKANKILEEFSEYKIFHVPRDKNQEADALARQGVKKCGFM